MSNITIPHQIDTYHLAQVLAKDPVRLGELLNHIGIHARAGTAAFKEVREILHDPNCAGRFFLAAVKDPLVVSEPRK